MGAFAVCVTMILKPGAAVRFAPLAAAQAAASRQEPGCRVFDVWCDPARSDSWFLYEVYDDAAAFDAHLATPHFARFDAAVRDMVVEKTVTTWSGRPDGASEGRGP